MAGREASKHEKAKNVVAWMFLTTLGIVQIAMALRSVSLGYQISAKKSIVPHTALGIWGGYFHVVVGTSTILYMILKNYKAWRIICKVLTFTGILMGLFMALIFLSYESVFEDCYGWCKGIFVEGEGLYVKLTNVSYKQAGVSTITFIYCAFFHNCLCN